MPMYFGYSAHRDHGAPWRQPRLGRRIQHDPAYSPRWYRLKEEAFANDELFRRIERAQRNGFTPREFVDYVEADLDGVIAVIRRREVARDRSRV